MSWSIMVMHLPPNVQSVSDIPKDFSPPPLGTRAELIDLLKQFAPDLKTDQPERLHIPATGDDLEIGLKEPVVSFSIRNPSDEIIRFLQANTDWGLIDALRGTILVHDSRATGDP